MRDAIARLRALHGAPAPPPTTDVFELVLFENIAYLATPARRREAFEQLSRELGTSPASILRAADEALERVTARGILKAVSAGKLRECARIAIDEFDGDLDGATRGPLDAAKRALRRFPGIGEPGAEKILLFAGRHALLAPESNGLRVLARLGAIHEQTSYAKMYAESRIAAKQLPARARALQEAHLLLKQHGQTVCKGSAPHCEECPLAGGCAYAIRGGRRA